MNPSVNKYIYFGSDHFSLEVLKILYQKQAPAAIVTQPDRPAGRKQKIQIGPLAQFAKANNIPLIQPEHLKSIETQERIFSFDAQLFIVVSFGQILPKSFLEAAPPIINGHASLLPKYRGASPIQSSILNGESKTGITIMHIVPKLDAGPMISKREVQILPEDNHQSLSLKLIQVCSELIDPLIDAKEIPIGTIQEETEATHCGKLNKHDAKLDPLCQSTIQMDRIIRAFAPTPGAYLSLKKNNTSMRLKILEAVIHPQSYKIRFTLEQKKLFLTGMDSSESLQLIKVQPEGKKAMDLASFLNGWQYPLEIDE